LSIMCHL